jgi:hypothetical protein
MIDTSQEYEVFLREFEAFLRARSKQRRSRMQPLIWFERGFNQVLKAFLQIADSFAKAMIR